MTGHPPHPYLFSAIAHLLAAFRQMLQAASPEGFAAISAEARARLAHLSAMVRRYIHALAQDMTLPAPQARSIDPATPHRRAKPSRRPAEGRAFPLIEVKDVYRANARHDTDTLPPALQWALLWEAARRLSGVMADPARHARRLARALQVRVTSGLRSLPVRWSVLRRLSPEADTLLTRLDQLAQPAAWAGIDTS